MKLKSIIYLLLFGLLVASGHILQKIVLNMGVDKLVFAFLRITSGLILITIPLLLRHHDPVATVKNNFRHFIVLGIGFSGIGILLKLWGLQNTTATNASFIMSLSSVTVLIFARIFLKERTGKGFFTIVIAMIGGIYLVTTAGEMITPKKGDLIIFCLAFLIGGMRVYGKNVLKKMSVLETAFGRSLFGAFFLLVLILIFSPGGFSTIGSFPLFLLVISNGITFAGSIVFFYAALVNEGASNSGMFAMLVPVFTLVMADLILGESFNIYQFIGGGIVLTGSFLISKIRIRQANF